LAWPDSELDKIDGKNVKWILLGGIIFCQALVCLVFSIQFYSFI
jgi:hypothetical protein